MPDNPWQTKSSRVMYQNPWMSVRQDEVIRPDGQPGIYGVVDMRPSVCVLALNDRDEAVLVGQWRYTLDRYSWELPRGGSHPGETDMLEVAKRELAEETGTLAADWQKFGPHDVCNGLANDVQSFFVATQLSPTQQNLDPEEDITVEWHPFDEVLKMALDGRITEVCSVALILKYALIKGRIA